MNFWITGMEVIQAVQTPDNAVPLIGHKATFVRVYVKSDVAGTLSGRLHVPAPGGGTRELQPINSPITATPQGSRREQWGESLNFRLDDDLTAPGTSHATATVFAASTGPEPSPPPSHVQTLQLNFGPRVDLHVYGVVWAATNNNDNMTKVGPAAPWSDFEGHRRFVENVYPVS